MQRNYVTLSGQVMSLEKQLSKIEEKLRSTLAVDAAAREATVADVR